MTYKEIFDIVFQIMLLIVGGLLVPYLKSKIGEAKYARIIDTVGIAVGAAEQIYKSLDKGEIKNKMRYQYVLDFLAEKNIMLTESELKALIEDTVLRLNEAVRT